MYPPPAVSPQLKHRARLLHEQCSSLASKLEAVPRRQVMEHLRDLAQVALELVALADGAPEAKPEQPHAPLDILPFNRHGTRAARRNRI